MIMPFINAIGRSYQAIFASQDEAKLKAEREAELRAVILCGEKMRVLAQSDGWKALAQRHDVRIGELQSQLERAEPGELKLIQAQIAVLRSVSSIDAELRAGEAAADELEGMGEVQTRM